MTTVQAFNQLMKAFLKELHDTFPERGLGLYLTGFDVYVAMDPAAALNSFMNAITPHAQLIMTQNHELFTKDLGLGCDVDFNEIYNDPGITPNTRTAIWKYLQTLYFLGMTVQGMDSATLQSLENVAMQAATTMQSTGQFDFAQVMSSMSSILGETFPQQNNSSLT
jgi:hypothetical protein